MDSFKSRVERDDPLGDKIRDIGGDYRPTLGPAWHHCVSTRLVMYVTRGPGGVDGVMGIGAGGGGVGGDINEGGDGVLGEGQNGSERHRRQGGQGVGGGGGLGGVGGVGGVGGIGGVGGVKVIGLVKSPIAGAVQLSFEIKEGGIVCVDYALHALLERT